MTHRKKPSNLSKILNRIFIVYHVVNWLYSNEENEPLYFSRLITDQVMLTSIASN
ncbi:hypothetical protein QWZ16_07435 [Vibrio ostreicida]|uniref:Uncharacterized protein n=1 Tax=Vibrio ostreicida TaxID=526588 RepID=A0ABT8BTY3_9VIBR|nr:hypothetical protein [Vibrio ostreicida]MDN3609533.1 hypothetical protein [Vibrio ostreicida]